MNPLKGACIIGQSGGPTAVINASALGAIQAALQSEQVTRVLGAANGIEDNAQPLNLLAFLNRNELWDDVLILGCLILGRQDIVPLDLADDGQAVEIMADFI